VHKTNGVKSQKKRGEKRGGTRNAALPSDGGKRQFNGTHSCRTQYMCVKLSAQGRVRKRGTKKERRDCKIRGVAVVRKIGASK